MMENVLFHCTSCYRATAILSSLCHTCKIYHPVMVMRFSKLGSGEIRGMFEMNCLLSSNSISTWGTIKTNTYLYRTIQYLHNGI